MAKVSGVKVDYQTGSSNTVYAVWDFKKDHLDHYEVKWYYYTGDGVAFSGGDSSVKTKNSTYSYPSNAIKVGVKIKPVSKKSKTIKGRKDKDYWWAGQWSTLVTKNVSTIIPPSTPPTPTVSIDRYTLVATLSNIDLNAKNIEFQIVKNDTSLVNTCYSEIVTNSATSPEYTITPGGTYKVRCRSWKGEVKTSECSGWSDYSSNISTIPATPASILECRALSETDAYLDWTKVDNATYYTVEYTDDYHNFGSSQGNVSSQSTEENSGLNCVFLRGLESDKRYYFRIKAVNDLGSSGWCPAEAPYPNVQLNTIPTVPTTWSSTTTCKVGDVVTLNWTHNSENGHVVESSKIELKFKNAGGVPSGTVTNYVITSKEVTSYEIDTSTSPSFVDGTVIEWRVKTSNSSDASDETKFSEWSVLRKITLNAPPTLEIAMRDKDENSIETLTSFPFYISDITDRTNQTIIGYHLSIVSGSAYETTDQIGNAVTVSKDETIYSKYFDIADNLSVEFSPSNIDLENNVEYKVVCTVTISNGLSAEASLSFVVGWSDDEYELDAEIGYDEQTYTTSIHPYCIDENEELVDGIYLSVYRREFDGSFTTIMTDIENLSDTAVTDPHPALDYARYRIVGIDKSTGAVSYVDLPGIPIGESSVIIQWNEKWSTFDAIEEDIVSQVPWSGSLLKLPYNIDISDKYGSDVSMVSYIGRKRPVSYYGTQLGETSTWSMEIPKEDKETLYTLRRLAIWMGDVYVREPSGSGYWANVKVSYSQKHCEVTIPVSLEVTRVEGGM